MGNAYVRSAKNWDHYESKNIQNEQNIHVAKHVHLSDKELKGIVL
jgi:hypothetical protein